MIYYVTNQKYNNYYYCTATILQCILHVNGRYFPPYCPVKPTDNNNQNVHPAIVSQLRNFYD